MVAGRSHGRRGAGARRPVRDTVVVPPRRTNLVTIRALVLAAVFVIVGITVAYPARAYLHQQSQLNQLHQQVRQKQNQLDALTETDKRWQDPDYVKEQATKRLGFVMPGTTTVIPLQAPSSTPGPLEKPAAPDSQKSWYERLYDSAVTAGGGAP